VVRFLKSVFNAEGDARTGRPAEIRIADSIIMVSDAGGVRDATSSFLYVYVENADETYKLALAAGALRIEEPMDTPYGDRRATVQDPWGNTWQIAAYTGAAGNVEV
jgi:uncharacterized glyoxalase superfamily protein PhnB